jgi:hypothetical protein
MGPLQGDRHRRGACPAARGSRKSRSPAWGGAFSLPLANRPRTTMALRGARANPQSPPDPGTAGKGFPRSFWGTLFLSVTAALICYYVHRRASPPRRQVISPILLLERLPVREVGRPKRLTSWNGRGSSVSSWGALLTNRALLLQEAPGQFRTYSPVLLEWHAEGPSSVGLASG